MVRAIREASATRVVLVYWASCLLMVAMGVADDAWLWASTFATLCIVCAARARDRYDVFACAYGPFALAAIASDAFGVTAWSGLAFVPLSLWQVRRIDTRASQEPPLAAASRSVA